MKPIFEAEFELAGETKQFFTFMIKNSPNPPDFHPAKIYIKKEFCKDLKSKNIKITVTEKEK
jgi:hypothetical protein